MTGIDAEGDSDEARRAAKADRLTGPTFEERAAIGRTGRTDTPRSAHGNWSPAADRPDPIAILEEQAATRVPELVPIRYGRMLVSPFTFYRGAAAIMAEDLAATPTSGITVQLCGDAHLSNFGVFGTPEREMIFDINDFDETLPGPWEWDVKRLAASFEICGRHRGFTPTECRDVAASAVSGYRERMRKSAGMPTLAAWYDRLDADTILDWIRTKKDDKLAGTKEVQRTEKNIAKARTRDSMRVFSKLVAEVDGELRFKADPPLIVPVEDLAPPGRQRQDTEENMRNLLQSYQETLLHHHHPLEEYRYVHMARKVVGVGSVGTRAWVLLLLGRDHSDPLILQAKEAQASVLERHLAPSVYANHGERVVRGQRMMQAASDIFLGWQRVPDYDGQTRDFYLRQLHDWKGSVNVETIRVPGATLYARVCGQTLARAHARSGDRVAIAAYLGKGDAFDRAVATFSSDYADQNERDYEAFTEAVSSGRLEAVTGV
jgi:uncharacterized protein (DUF2252 family)